MLGLRVKSAKIVAQSEANHGDRPIDLELPQGYLTASRAIQLGKL
jgi:hypothetical protein